jgi:mannose-6-phosphate isomerase-like protein (cupin superfamily)
VSEERADAVQWTGTKVTFVPMGEGSAYELSEWDVEPGAAGPPIHIHHHHDEGFYVISGHFGFVLDAITTYAKPGAHVLVPKGHSHSFWNAGTRPGRLLLIVSPPGMTEYFRATAAALEGVDTPEGSIAARKLLQQKYDLEIVGPPAGPETVA